MLNAIVLEAMGPENPLAATLFAFLLAAANLPVTYMTWIDGRAYAWRGLTGGIVADGAFNLCAAASAWIWLARRKARASAPALEYDVAAEAIIEPVTEG